MRRGKTDVMDKIVVLVTCASRRQAAEIGRAVVEQRLAACANIVQAPIRSIYRWKGKVETAREFLLILKTSGQRFDALRKAIERLHNYDLPEIIAIPIAEGAAGYLSWISESVKRS